MKRYFFKTILILLSTGLFVNGYAEEGHFEQLDAHVHGEARLNLVLEGTQIMVEMETPAANVLGFEHNPRNDEQKQLLNTALGIFRQSKNIFKFHGGNCRQSEFEKEIHEIKTHMEFHFRYLFDCQSIDSLKQIEMKLFDQFPRFDMIEAQWIFLSGQGTTNLDPRNRLIKVK